MTVLLGLEPGARPRDTPIDYGTGIFVRPRSVFADRDNRRVRSAVYVGRSLATAWPPAIAMPGINEHWLSLSGSITGPHALKDLPDLTGVEVGAGDQLLIAAKRVTGIDAFGAALIRAAIERHITDDPAATACVWQPDDAIADRRLHTLLGSLPEQCVQPTGYHVPRHDSRVIVPALPVADMSEAELVGRALLVSASHSRLGNLRLAHGQAYFMAMGAVALLDNALAHARHAPCSPIVCCAINAESRDVQLVVLDLGESVATDDEPLERVRDLIEKSHKKSGGLTNLLNAADRRDLYVSMAIRSGTAFARWDQGWETREVVHGPGWGIGITLHRDKSVS